MCFLWQSNELLIFLLPGVSTTPLVFWSDVFSQLDCYSFPNICFCFHTFFSSRYMSLFTFLYAMPTVAPHSLLWPRVVHPCMPCIHPCCLFPLCIPFFQPLLHHTLYNGALCLAFFLAVVSF